MFNTFDNIKKNIIEDCLLITRVITTTTLGPGQSFKLRTKTYLRPEYKIVKETLEIAWDIPSWLDADGAWKFVSGIEYKNDNDLVETNNTPDNFFVNYQTLEHDDFDSIEDFNYDVFRILDTMGLLRIESIEE